MGAASRAPASGEVLEAVRASVQVTLSQISVGFGNLSDRMDELHGATGELQGSCRGLFELLGDEGECLELLRNLSRSLKADTEGIQLAVRESAQLRGLMEACERCALSLLRKQASMIDTLKPLRTMLVLFKIEAAALPSEHQSAFNAVSNEILKLHTMVDEAFQSTLGNLTEACSEIGASINRIEKERTSFAGEIEREVSVAEALLRELEGQLSECGLNDRMLHEASDRFAGATASLVSSLQFEDIVRQRCETILGLIEDGQSDLSPEALQLVLSKQLERAGEEMERSVASIRENLRGISRQSAEFEQAVGSETVFAQLVETEDGTIEQLLRAQAFASRCSRRNRDLVNMAQAAVAPVGDLANSLSKLVVEMSINLHFIALNAQVRSIQVGAGSGLEVLAAQTVEISTALWECGRETDGEIKELEGIVEKMSAQMSAYSGTAGESAEAEEAGMAERLRTLRQSAVGELERIRFLAQQVGVKVDAESNFDFTSAPGGKSLDALARDLALEVDFSRYPEADRRRIEAEVEEHVAQSRATVHTQIDRVTDFSAERRSTGSGANAGSALDEDVVFF